MGNITEQQALANNRVKIKLNADGMVHKVVQDIDNLPADEFTEEEFEKMLADGEIEETRERQIIEVAVTSGSIYIWIRVGATWKRIKVG